MPQIINTNMASLNAQRNLSTSQNALATSLQRLSSGLRINSAKDDAAGLAITSRMTSQINGLNQAVRNANDGISLAQTAEGALGTVGDALQRMRQLAVQAANGTNSASDRTALQAEITQLISEISRVAATTTFNGTNLLDGSLNNSQFQVGANANEVINAAITSSAANAIGNYGVGNQVATATVAGNNTTVGSSLIGLKSGTETALGTVVATSGTIAQTLTITGSGGPTASKAVTVPVGSATSTQGSAHDIVAAINAASNTTGVTASAITRCQLGGFTAQTYTLRIFGNPAPGGGANTNGITVSAIMSSPTDVSGLAQAINTVQGTTGVTAVADTVNGTILLSNSSGYDISVGNMGTAAACTVQSIDTTGVTVGAATALAANTVAGSVLTVGGAISLSSAQSFTVSSSVAAGVGGALLSVTGAAANAASGSILSTVSTIDVTTLTGSIPTGANNALAAIDGALQSVNASRASLGAMQSRFQSVVTNLMTTAENLTASRSRIQDTDFAAETASLTRGQILQQAGTAMLAQANTLPNTVLQLLR